MNRAKRGGAIFVEDRTNFKTCGKVHSYVDGTNCNNVTEKKKNLNHFVGLTFTDNKADETGSVLFGGLLDRCTIINTTTYSKYYSLGSGYQTIDGVTYFRKISTIDNNLAPVIKAREISSQICFCNPDGLPDCGFDISPIHVKKGERFNISLVAVDQISQTLAHVTIHAFFGISENGLGENQMAQNISDIICTNLTFNIYSSKSIVELNLYPDGPCDSAGKSTRTIVVEFLNCSYMSCRFSTKAIK